MASKAAQKLKRGKVPKSCRVSVMDEAKALGIFGFTSRRWLDYSSGLTPKEELDKAHFAKMTYIMKKKVRLKAGFPANANCDFFFRIQLLIIKKMMKQNESTVFEESN